VAPPEQGQEMDRSAGEALLARLLETAKKEPDAGLIKDASAVSATFA
jgi:hypothetical protein